MLLGGTETADLSRYVKAGEVNRFVVQHVDDCAAQCWLGKVELVVNGAAVQNSTAPAMTWGRMKILYR